MNSRAGPSAAIVALVTFALAAAGCGHESNAPPADRSPASSAVTPAPSVPDAAVATQAPSEAGSNSATANANDPSMKPMTKAEERNAMPMPGQANDHSTLANDAKKP